MMTTHKQIAGLVCVLLGVTGAHSAAAQPAKINKCTKIQDPGSYVVVKNLLATGDCLVVAASFVVLDLGGFTVAGDGTGSGVKVADPLLELESIDVRNGTLTKFQTGVDLAEARRSAVEGVRAVYNVGDGIRVGGSSVITGNIGSENGGVGIGAGGSSSVTRNIADFNGSHGINASNSVVAGNNTRRNGGDGIRSLGSGSAIIGNQTSGNDGNGVTVVGAVVRENGVISNDGDGINASCPSSIVGNTVTNSMGSNIATNGVGCVLADNATN